MTFILYAPASRQCNFIHSIIIEKEMRGNTYHFEYRITTIKWRKNCKTATFQSIVSAFVYHKPSNRITTDWISIFQKRVLDAGITQFNWFLNNMILNWFSVFLISFNAMQYAGYNILGEYTIFIYCWILYSMVNGVMGSCEKENKKF